MHAGETDQSNSGRRGTIGTGDRISSHTSTNIAFERNEPIEKYFNVDPQNNYRTPQAQPQVHVGILPIPKLNPGSELTGFQNTCVYYEVNFEMDVTIDIESIYSKGILHVQQRHVQFQPTKPYNNTQQPTLYGFSDMGIDKDKTRGT